VSRSYSGKTEAFNKIFTYSKTHSIRIYVQRVFLQKEMRLSTIVEVVDAEIIRDGNFENLGFVSESLPEMLSFLVHPRFLGALERNTCLRALLTTPALAASAPDHLALAVCDQPRVAFALFHNYLCDTGFYWEDFPTTIDSAAQVHPSAYLAEKNVRIGAGSIVGPRAAILERCVIGSACLIGVGSILGGVGLQTVQTDEGLLEMRHAGGLVLGDRVHVLPGAVLATGLFRQNTQIGSDTRVGSQSFVSHGVHIGSATFLGHGSVLNGHVWVGDEAWIGPGAIVAQNVNIADRAVVSLGGVVIRDVNSGSRVSGNFAVPHRTLLRSVAAMKLHT
jgi:UDP-3-O-[3-hydroxymyristoyl] glucosamine N-acyltransferase